MDRHKYVRKVCHGKQELNSAEKKAVYGSHVLSFTESNYVNIDTLFLLIDALLFTSLVDLADNNPGLINKSYEEMYKDVRASVDLCHRDGVIKDAVIKDPAKHIIYDTGMVPMLRRLKQAGKKVLGYFSGCFSFSHNPSLFLRWDISHLLINVKFHLGFSPYEQSLGLYNSRYGLPCARRVSVCSSIAN